MHDDVWCEPDRGLDRLDAVRTWPPAADVRLDPEDRRRTRPAPSPGRRGEPVDHASRLRVGTDACLAEPDAWARGPRRRSRTDERLAARPCRRGHARHGGARRRTPSSSTSTSTDPRSYPAVTSTAAPAACRAALLSDSWTIPGPASATTGATGRASPDVTVASTPAERASRTTLARPARSRACGSDWSPPRARRRPGAVREGLPGGVLDGAHRATGRRGVAVQEQRRRPELWTTIIETRCATTSCGSEAMRWRSASAPSSAASRRCCSDSRCSLLKPWTSSLRRPTRAPAPQAAPSTMPAEHCRRRPRRASRADEDREESE